MTMETPLNSPFHSFYLILALTCLILTSESSAHASLSSICKSTPQPSFFNQTSNLYDFNSSSIETSLSRARGFVPLVKKYLKTPENLNTLSIHALQDCQLLAEGNIDYLTTISEISNQSMIGIGEEVVTLLSAVLTNAETCIDGLRSTNLSWNEILTSLSEDMRLFNNSLSLFVKTWVPLNNTMTSKKFIDGNVKLKMSKRNEAIYAYAKRGKGLDHDTNKEGDVVFINDVVIVNQNGEGNFTTINDAVDAAPNKSKERNGYFLIYVKAGIYEEYVNISKKKRYLMMIGDGINQTIVTGNHNYVDGWTTFKSATFTVAGEGFVGINMTFRNTAGAIKEQAVALLNTANLTTFYRCSFEGYQDTLYVHAKKQFYKECDIYGTVDFIFGNAAAIFLQCNVYPRLPINKQVNTIIAQGRKYPDQNTGILLYNCTIRAADDLANSNKLVQTYLGRPWKEYARTVIMQSYLDSFINPKGWLEWKGDFALKTLYYAEYNNSGPGSEITNRVNWTGYHVLEAKDAASFSVEAFLYGDNWMPQPSN